ncbi:MAG: DeoR/GlpR family DNA-binding transcription regulator [Oscillospiraceae bacterium]|nr:DeoR/GlpR family DNA-binding transcription regulator [Oscillospiraceae bacterium]
MLYNERIEIIMQQLQLYGTVKVNEMTRLMDVSVDTVRRDLKSMENSGMLKCIRGGACLPENLGNMSNFSGREIINIGLKREVARKALKYIKEGSVIALNSGTTNTILAQELAQKKESFTVITNNLAAIAILMQNTNINLIAIGGQVDSLENSTYGSVCEHEFGLYYPDIAFLSINAVSDVDGFTDFRLYEFGIIKLLADKAEKVIAVMDSNKIGKRSRKMVLSSDDVDIIITDDNVPEEIKKYYKSKGFNLE